MATLGVVKVRLPENTHLGSNEDITSFEQWKFRISQHLNAIQDWQFLLDKTWKRPCEDRFRGFVDDVDKSTVADESDKSKIQVKSKLPTRTSNEKCLLLEQMIEFIAGYANPVAMREELLEESTSLKNIWYRIKCFYQIQRRECRALELPLFKMNDNERPEAFYRRLKRFYVDLLQNSEDTVLYKGKPINSEELMSPLGEKLLMVNWLQLIHHKLPSVVSKRFSLQLLSNSLQDLRVPITDLIPNMLSEINNEEINSSALYVKPRSGSSVNRPGQFSKKFNPSNSNKSITTKKSCELCTAKGRAQADTHDITDCFLLDSSKRQNLSSKFRIAQCMVNNETDEVTEVLDDLSSEEQEA